MHQYHDLGAICCVVQVARQIAVPTNDNQVRAKLREHGEAICLFGETVRAPRYPSNMTREDHL